jgi:hypothetical protein
LNGSVQPHDHAEIGAGDGVIRRISALQTVVKDGQRKISSIAYKASGDTNGGMSVDLERFINDAGHDVATWVTSPRWIGSVRFTAGFLRSQAFKVGYDPIAAADNEPANPFHGEVWGQFTKGKQRALQQAATWCVAIPDVSLF